jgi:hypothetical protein
MDDESLNIHGLFKAILGLVAVSMVANIVFFFIIRKKLTFSIPIRRFTH